MIRAATSVVRISTGQRLGVNHKDCTVVFEAREPQADQSKEHSDQQTDSGITSATARGIGRRMRGIAQPIDPPRHADECAARAFSDERLAEPAPR